MTDEQLVRQEEAERMWEAVCPENVSTCRGLGELRRRGEAPEGQDSQLSFLFFVFFPRRKLLFPEIKKSVLL